MTLRNFILLFTLLFASSFILKSQTTENAVQYRIQYAFSERVTTAYKLTCSTEVTRTYSDNSTKTFSKTVEVYLSFLRLGSSNDGFIDLQTTFDSINYEYKSDKEHYKWASLTDDNFPTNSDYLNTVFPIVGRSYIAVLSPYFEVAKIDGNLLKETRSMISKITDTVQKGIWEKANSDINLTFYADMNKNVLQNGRFAIDSVWQNRFAIPIEGIRYACDTAKTTFYLYDGRNFNIKAEMDQMYPELDDKNFVIGEENKMLAVDSTSSSKGTWDISVSPRGMLNSATGNFETIANYSKPEKQFTDLIKTNIKYEFLKTK